MNRFALAATGGVIAHALFWLLVVNLDSTPWDFKCGEISCWVLFASELPVSVLYISGSALQATLGSLIFGSLWWGAVVGGAAWVVKKLRDRLANVRSAP